ncbi:hypothetical protein ACLOJK_016930 [Asimina triloba]
MEGQGDLHDWEILQNPDENRVPARNSHETWRKIDQIGSDSDVGAIWSEYFAVHHGKKSSDVDQDGGVIESSNSGSVDVPAPGDEVGAKKAVGAFELNSAADFGHGGDAKREVSFGGIEVSSGEAVEFLSLSGAADVASWKVEGYGECGFGDDAKGEAGLEGIREIEVEPKNSEEFWSDMSSDDGMVFQHDSKGELGCEEGVSVGGIAIGSRQTDELSLDSGSKVLVTGESGVPVGAGELFDGEFSKEGNGSSSLGMMEAETDVGQLLPVPNAAADGLRAGDGEKKAVVWWKMPLELLKFCVFRVSPVWSVSLAAAILGIVILRRRLYKMKRKSRSIPLNVSVNEKVRFCLPLISLAVILELIFLRAEAFQLISSLFIELTT